MIALRREAPRQVKVIGRRLAVAVGEHTSGLRMVPSFLLVGAQRCGTTSLFRALSSHPAVLPAVFHKGVNYFDVNYDRGRRWYLGHFAVRSTAELRARRAGELPRAFDASGYYMFHPHAPGRIGQELPGVKVLAMLRDPVERALSAYRHEFARGFETEPLERALELEDERVEPELERMLANPGYASFSHRHHAYRRRGQYAEQLERLYASVGRGNVLVVDSHAFFTRPEEEYDRVIDFLGLRPHRPSSFDVWNARPAEATPQRAERMLRTALEPYDRSLEPLLGGPPSWRV